LLSAGPLSWTQGLEDAIQVVGLLLDRGIAARLRIVGAGDDLDALCFARHQLGLERHVEFRRAERGVNWGEQMEWADALLDVSVRDSPREALSQARSSAVPAFTTTVQGGDGADAGMDAVRSRDPEAVAQAIATVTRQAAASPATSRS